MKKAANNSSRDIATKKDLNILHDKFDKKLGDEFRLYEIKLDFKLDDFRMKIGDKFQLYNSQIMNTLDTVMKQLENIQEEQTVGFGQLDELVITVNGHEKRIKKLEKVVAA